MTGSHLPRKWRVAAAVSDFLRDLWLGVVPRRFRCGLLRCRLLQLNHAFADLFGHQIGARRRRQFFLDRQQPGGFLFRLVGLRVLLQAPYQGALSFDIGRGGLQFQMFRLEIS